MHVGSNVQTLLPVKKKHAEDFTGMNFEFFTFMRMKNIF